MKTLILSLPIFALNAAEIVPVQAPIIRALDEISEILEQFEAHNHNTYAVRDTNARIKLSLIKLNGILYDQNRLTHKTLTKANGQLEAMNLLTRADTARSTIATRDKTITQLKWLNVLTGLTSAVLIGERVYRWYKN